MSNEVNNASASGEYIAFFARTRNKFWRSAPNGAPVACDRDWVETHELFKVFDDPRTGATLIQSDSSGKYLEVRSSDSKLSATTDRAVQEARFKIEYDGSILAYNGKYVEVPQGRTELTATSGIGAPFIQFSVRSIAISNIGSSIYATLGSYNGKNAVAFDSKTPYRFYWLCDGAGNSYLETSDYRYLYPIDSIEPVTYERTEIDQNNYKVFFEPIEGKTDIYGIKSAFSNMYYRSDVVGGKTYLMCNATDCKGTDAQFKITLIR